MQSDILIFTDGACSGNPGPGGWGAIILTPDDQVFELGGRVTPTTNNRMELLAAIQGLESTRHLGDLPLQVLTDSTYVISGITRWVGAWLKRGWQTAEGKAVVNVDLWQQLLTATQKRKVIWRHVRGHAGTPGNEKADQIAVQFCRGGRAELFRGSLRDYGIDLRDIPDVPRSADKGPTKTTASIKKPFSYVSLIGGVPRRHATWAECEKRVKGQPVAKFRKTLSAAHESEILRNWGFPEGLP